MKRTFSRQCVPQRFEVLSGNEVALRSQEIDHLAVDGQTSGRFATQLADDISNASLKSLALRLAVHHKARQRRLGIEHNQRAGGDELVNGTLSRGELDRDEGPVTRARRDKHAVATSPTLVQMRCNSIDQRSRFVEEVHQVLADDAAPHDALAMWRHVFRAYALPRLLIITIDTLEVSATSTITAVVLERIVTCGHSGRATSVGPDRVLHGVLGMPTHPFAFVANPINLLDQVANAFRP